MDPLNTRVTPEIKTRVKEYKRQKPDADTQSDAVRELLVRGLESVEQDDDPAPQPEIDWLQLYAVVIAATLTTVFVAAAGLLAVGIGSTAYTGALLVGAIAANAAAYLRARTESAQSPGGAAA